jgi:hypothetical protein
VNQIARGAADHDEALVARLAAEIAANLRPAADILATHGLSVDQFKLIAATPQFRSIFAEAKRLWHEDVNASERVRQKALLALEEMLVPLVGIVHDTESSASAKLEGIKVTTKLAGMEKQPGDAAGAGSGFSVTINLPGQPPATITAEAERIEE